MGVEPVKVLQKSRKISGEGGVLKFEALDVKFEMNEGGGSKSIEGASERQCVLSFQGTLEDVCFAVAELCCVGAVEVGQYFPSVEFYQEGFHHPSISNPPQNTFATHDARLDVARVVHPRHKGPHDGDLDNLDEEEGELRPCQDENIFLRVCGTSGTLRTLDKAGKRIVGRSRGRVSQGRLPRGYIGHFMKGGGLIGIAQEGGEEEGWGGGARRPSGGRS